MADNFDVPDATWVSYTEIGSPYEQELDVSRKDGKMRHRLRSKGDEPHASWIEGPAPSRTAA